MSKYNAVRVTDEGKRFDSKAEHRRWVALRLLEQAGEISDLKHHPRYPLIVNGQKVCTYEADSAYIESGEQIVEDVKGVKTPVYNLKKKLMKILHGIDVREVKA